MTEQKRDAQYQLMTQTPIPRLVLRLAAPTVLSMLITSIYNLADTFFVGQLNDISASGAIGVVSSLMCIIQALGFMLGHGSGSLISQSLGAKDERAATRLASTGFFTALLLGVLLSVGGLLALEPFMYLLGSSETILPHAKGYALYILLAAPLMIASLVMNNILRYEGKAFFAMIALVSGGLLNIVLDPIFIFGFGMGTAGAGAATAISQAVSFSLLLSAYLNGKTVSRFSLRAYTRSVREFLRILAIGLPSFGRQGLASIAALLLNLVAGEWGGDPAIAAMSIVSRIFTFLMAVALGIGQGFQPVAAFNYGARRYRRVRYACLFTLGFSVLVVSAFTLGFWWLAPMLVRAFQNDAEVIAMALPAFRYQLLALLLQPVIVCTNMLYQSVGRALPATFLSICRQGLFFIPLILLLPTHMGLLGLQICQPVADAVTFAVAVPFLIAFLHTLGRADTADSVTETG